MRRVLILSPHFPPVNAPDLHRVRLALPHLPGLGWQPVVLGLDPSSIEGATLDPLLAESLPPEVPVHRVRGLSARFTRPFGVGSLWLRCGRALRRAGDDLLARGRFDLVFISTSQFDAFTLGPRWLARRGIPYVLDFQDPWVSAYRHVPGSRPPGGGLKYWLSQYSARRREPSAVLSAAGIVAVSPAYAPDLLARYPGLDPGRLYHLPFGAAAADLAFARSRPPASPLVPAGDGLHHHVYAGRVVDGMARPLSLLFRAFSRYLNSHPAEAARHRFHFLGTDYAPPALARRTALPVAEREGVAEHVSETPFRLPYFEALHYLASAGSLVVVGSDDPGYSASKIFPYLLARRPLVVLAHRDSQMLELARAQGIESALGFAAPSEADDEAIVARLHADWFAGGGHLRAAAGNAAAFAPHTAENMSARLAAVFDRAVATATASPSRP